MEGLQASSLLAFAGAVFLLACTPGPDTALALRWVVVAGRREGWLVAVGSMTGVAVHVTAATLGLSALLATSATAFTVLKLVGAAYLTALGVRLLLSRRSDEVAPLPRRRRVIPDSPYAQGALSGTLNPKIALFFLTLLPQFVDVDRAGPLVLPVLAAVSLAVMALFWLVFLGLVGGASSAVRRPSVQRRVEQVTGVAFLALGARLALASR